MKAVAGVFRSRVDAQHALTQIRSAGAKADDVTFLTPASSEAEVQSVPTVTAEQPGMGKALGAVLGASAGLSAGPFILSALIPGVGPITALGLLGGAVLAAAGGTVGAVAGEKLEASTTDGLPADELFVYEDALRKGRSVVIALAVDESTATRFRELLNMNGAESVDAAREQWWVGLRDAEHEHYAKAGRDLDSDEKFYRLGFESALHARTRCQEYDQVMGEMNADLEDLQRQYPDADVAEPFTRGYQRGREYYQRICDESNKAA